MTLLVIDRTGQGVTVSVEAVEKVSEENDHGKEDGQLGLHLQVSKVERSSPFTTSHESHSWAWGHNAGNMPYQRTSEDHTTDFKSYSNGTLERATALVPQQQVAQNLPCARVKKLHMFLGLSHSPSAFQRVKASKRTCRLLSNSSKVPARLSWMVAVDLCPSALSACALRWLLWQRLYRKPSTALPVWLPNPRPVHQTHAPSILSPRDTKTTAKKINRRTAPSPRWQRGRRYHIWKQLNK